MNDEIPLVDRNSQKSMKKKEFPEDPPETKWKYIFPCHCIPLAKLSGTSRIFFHGIEIQFESLMILFVLSLFVFTFYVFFSFILPHFQGSLHSIALYESCIILFLFLWSYFSASFSDPGFLPYDWFRTQEDWYSWQDQLSGLANTNEQFTFVDMNMKHGKPANSCFSRASGRFIVRGDHICYWICNWVGKRNHKQFLLMMFWAFVYCISMIIWSLLSEISKLRQLYYSLVVVSIVLELTFAFVLIVSLFGSLLMVITAQTKIQAWKNHPPEQKPTMEALRDVFGNDPICLWFIPTHAFGKEFPVPLRMTCL